LLLSGSKSPPILLSGYSHLFWVFFGTHIILYNGNIWLIEIYEGS